MGMLKSIQSLKNVSRPVSNSCANLFGAKDFQAKNIACVVSDELGFSEVNRGLEDLGFVVGCSSRLDTTFEVVSEDPHEWAMVIVRLDQPLYEERLESYVRLIRMMDFRIPIMLLSEKGKGPEEPAYPKLYADCVFKEPTTLAELSNCLKAAKEANGRWGSQFNDFRREAINRFALRNKI